MTSYELYKQIAYILSPNNAENLYKYIIHSMDDDSLFFRSRHCYSDKVIPDVLLSNEVDIVLAALQAPFAFESNGNYYKDVDCPIKNTKLKMELFLLDSSDEKSFETALKRSATVGFNYPIKINIKKKNYEILETYTVKTAKLSYQSDKKQRSKCLKDYFQEENE